MVDQSREIFAFFKFFFEMEQNKQAKDFSFNEELSEENIAYIMKKLGVENIDQLKKKFPDDYFCDHDYEFLETKKQKMWGYIFDLFINQTDVVADILRKLDDMPIFCISACVWVCSLQEHYKLLFGELGFDPNKAVTGFVFDDIKDITPIEYACWLHEYEMLKFLISEEGKLTDRAIRMIFWQYRSQNIKISGIIECLKFIRNEIGCDCIMMKLTRVEFEQFVRFFGTNEEFEEMLDLIFLGYKGGNPEWKKFLEGNFLQPYALNFKNIMKKFPKRN